MRKSLAICACVALGLFALFTAACCVLPLTEWTHPSRERMLEQPCDFRLRYNEILCLRDGVNPYDVWIGDVVKAPFYPNFGATREYGPEFTEQINAYAPWEYVGMLPLTFFSRPVSWVLYLTLMFVSLTAISLCGFRFGKGLRGDSVDGLLMATLPILGVAYPLWSNFCIGNFSVIVLAALALMALCLELKHDVWAGVFWAVAMLKPQLGVLFAVPLLMRRKMVTVCVAAAICLAGTFVASALCGTSPVDLIVQTPKANLFMFKGCGTWPYCFCSLLGGTPAVVVALLIGLAVCSVLSWQMRMVSSWCLYLLPTVVCATTWTYASTYGHALNWFLFAALVAAWIRGPATGALGLLTAIACVSATRLYPAWHGFTSGFSGAFPALVISENTHCHLDSLNSLFDLALMVVLCLCFVPRSTKFEQGVTR